MSRARLLTILFGALLLTGLALHLKVALVQPLYGDEISSIFFANSYSYQQLFAKPIEVIHPNTFYVLLKLLLQLGVHISGLRVLQWLIFCATIWPVFQIFKKLKLTNNLALAGATVWVWSAYLLRFSYLIRMYGLGILLVCFSLLLALDFTRKPKRSTFLLQLLIDILGVNLVMGYWFFVAKKYVSLLWHQKKAALLALGIFAALSVSTLSAIATSQQSIARTYLYWVPLPKLTDIFPMITALLGATSTAYFEGFAQASSSLATVTIVLVSLVGLVTLYIRKRKFDFFDHLATGSLACLFLLFLSGVLCKLPFFHIRQLFPIAIILTLFLVRAALSSFGKKAVLTTILILPLLIFGVRKTLSYTLSSEPLYPKHFQNKPEGAVYFTTADIELAYLYCGATSFSDLTEKCPQHNLHLLESNSEPLPEKFTVTASAAKFIDTEKNTCTSLSADFQTCKTSR